MIYGNPKICKKCGESQRYVNGKCVTCARERTKRFRQSERGKERRRVWQNKSDCFKRSLQKYRQSLAGKAKMKAYSQLPEVKAARRKYKYGIEDLEFNARLNQQDSCCAICKKHQTVLSKTLAVDHDHRTGKIRGLLCSKCNCLLGHCSDDIEILKSAIFYLTNC